MGPCVGVGSCAGSSCWGVLLVMGNGMARKEGREGREGRAGRERREDGKAKGEREGVDGAGGAKAIQARRQAFSLRFTNQLKHDILAQYDLGFQRLILILQFQYSRYRDFLKDIDSTI